MCFKQVSPTCRHRAHRDVLRGGHSAGAAAVGRLRDRGERGGAEAGGRRAPTAARWHGADRRAIPLLLPGAPSGPWFPAPFSRSPCCVATLSIRERDECFARLAYTKGGQRRRAAPVLHFDRSGALRFSLHFPSLARISSSPRSKAHTSLLRACTCESGPSNIGTR